MEQSRKKVLLVLFLLWLGRLGIVIPISDTQVCVHGGGFFKNTLKHFTFPDIGKNGRRGFDLCREHLILNHSVLGGEIFTAPSNLSNQI